MCRAIALLLTCSVLLASSALAADKPKVAKKPAAPKPPVKAADLVRDRGDGVDRIPLKDGKQLDWRVELARKLVATQKVEAKSGRGYWVNENGRYWENDPVLVTAYTLLALELL